MTDPSDPRSAPRAAFDRRWLRRLPLVVILCSALVGAVFLRDQLGFASLARHQETLVAFRDAHYALSVLGFLMAYVAIVAFSLPGATVASLAGGFLFNLFPGVAYNVLGAGTGAILVFLAARAGFGTALLDRLEQGGGRAARLKERLAENEWSVLFLMRLAPVVPFFLANLIPAAFGTRLWRYAVTTYLGIIPGAFVFTSVGAGLGEVFAKGEAPDFSVLLTPGVLLPLLGLLGLAALPMVVNMLRKDH